MLPHRVAYWNIGPERILLFPIGVLAVGLLIYAVRRNYQTWRMGQPENRFDRPWDRLKGLLVYGFGNGRVVREIYPGIMHALIYGGLVVLFIGTVVDSAEYYLQLGFDLSFLSGTVYLGYSLVLDIASLAVLAGLLLAVYRRYVQRPNRLDNTTDDWTSLVLIAVVVVSGLLLEGFRIAVNEVAEHPDWSVWSPLGYLLALAINGMGIAGNVQLALHRLLWWLHLLSAQGWIAYIFYSKLGHILTAPLSIYFRNLQPGVPLKMISDWENAETFGVAKISEFTWRQLLGIDACVRCGRCQDNCPAYLTGKPLSPKKLVQDLKAQMKNAFVRLTLKGADTEEPAILGKTIGEPAIWACTTCGACHEMCPVFVEPVPKVVDIRRNLVMVESQMPEQFQAVLTNLERIGHPWTGTRYTRTDWIDEVGQRPLDPEEQVELLYWVGCTGALEDRCKKITLATVGILRAAGVSFGLLGNEEGCCGDAARRIGNEYLFQTMAVRNIEVLKSHGVKSIVTHCPHCFNTLKNEYPQLGGDFQVMHHSQLLADLIRQGRLRPNKAIGEKVIVHDSCYLGRYNHIYDAPREVLKSLPRITILEMRRSRERSFCCGGGGGHAWAEDQTGRRINDTRAEQALETGASVLAVACPFCLQMLEAGITSMDRATDCRVRDVSELLEEALAPEPDPIPLTVGCDPHQHYKRL